jgi:hypothetical protein
MIEYAVICSVAIVVSALTLFSGFGLRTLLMPAFALFFPINVAVASTAVVHLVNNLFKVGLVGKHANIRVVIRSIFGPAKALAGCNLIFASNGRNTGSSQTIRPSILPYYGKVSKNAESFLPRSMLK